MMATNKKEPKEIIEKAEPVALPLRLHIKEFVMTYAPHLDEMQKAGLKALSGGKDWMSKDEWQAILDGYIGKE